MRITRLLQVHLLLYNSITPWQTELGLKGDRFPQHTRKQKVSNQASLVALLRASDHVSFGGIFQEMYYKARVIFLKHILTSLYGDFPQKGGSSTNLALQAWWDKHTLQGKTK